MTGASLSLVKGLLAQHVLQSVSESAFGAGSPAVRELHAQMQQPGNIPASQLIEMAAAKPP